MKASTDSALLILCTSLHDLLLIDFIKCACNQEYEVLIRQGVPSEEQLMDCWIGLLSEFYRLSGASDVEKRNEDMAKLERHNTKIVAVTAIIEALRLEYNESLVAELRDTWEYGHAFTPESIEKDLKKVEVNLKNEHMRLEMARIAYKKEKPETEGQKQSEDDYYRLLIQLSDYKGHSINLDANKLSAYEFAIRVGEYKKYYDHVNKKYKGHGTK